MSPMAAPEKTVIVYYDDSTGEIYTDRDGHFHFTDLSGGHFPESQHGHSHQHGHHHHRQHQGVGIQPTSSHAAGQRRDHRTHGAAGVKAEVPGEALLNTLLAAGINVPIEAYRAHQEEARRQQKQLQQRTERQVVHPQERTMVGGRNSPFLVRHLTEDNVDGYVSAMKQAWEKQRLLQAEKQAERELQNQIGGHGIRSTRARADDEETPSSILSAPGRIGGAVLNAGRDGASPRADVLDLLRASCAESDADYRTPGEVKSVDRSHDAFVVSNQGKKLPAADSGSQRQQRNSIGRRARDERSASPKRDPAAAVHSATLVQTPQGLVIHFRPDGESESEVKNSAGRPNQSFADEDEEAEVNEEEQEGEEDREDYNDQRSQRLLARVGELSRIRAFVEDEEARLAAGLRERDVEVYRRQRCAELRARIRWAVDEQNRLTLEAEEFMAAADEKYDRVSRLGELVTSAERRLESLTAGLGGQAAARDEIAGASARAVGRLLRDTRRAREPDMELTDDEKDMLRCFAQYGPRESDTAIRSNCSENEPPGSKLKPWSGGAPDVRRGAAPSGERRSVRGNGAEQPRGWALSPTLSTFRSPQPPDFQRQSQFDGDWDVNAVSRRKQGYEGANDEEAGLQGRFYQTRHQRGQRPCRLSRPFRGNEDLINEECAASGQVAGYATQADVRGLLNMINNISGGQAPPFLSQGLDNERFAIMSRPSLRRSASSKSSNGEILSMTSGRGIATPSPRSASVVTGMVGRASRTTNHALRPVSPSGGSQHLRQVDFIQDAVRDVSTGRGCDQRAKRDDENRRQGALEVPTPQRTIPISLLSARAASSGSGNTDSLRGESAKPPSRSSTRSGKSGSAAAADNGKSDRIRSPRPLTPATRRPWFESEERDGGMTVAITHAQHNEVKKSQARQKSEQEAAATKIEKFLRNRLDTSTDRQTLHNLRILAQKEREIRALKEGTADVRQQQKQQQERLQRQQDQPPHERQTLCPTPPNLSQFQDDPVSRARAFAGPITVVLNAVEGKELTSFDRDSALPPGAHVHPRHRDFLAYEAELDRLLTELDRIQNAGGSDEVRELRKRLVTEVNGMLAEVDAKKREAYAATAARDMKEEGEEGGGGGGIEGPKRTAKIALNEQAKWGEERAAGDGSWDKLSELYQGENNEGERPYARVKQGEGEKRRAEDE